MSKWARYLSVRRVTRGAWSAVQLAGWEEQGWERHGWVGGAGVALARGCRMEEGPVFVPCVVWVECGELLAPSTE